ncbi:multifunctional CCA addition/repair protein [Pleionea sp. CnH1-48]|uniref:multifunctional CCA addition/repair protein n=1 Tax=Pleionea sp. CnH1-48 TaxID=2954494 RepID=UPI0020976806|nr:multifunctional CCA addition/repair protein [Pleionea sp. CnH1-48]MCO7225625.1 multifunctional CCA addition/repair protein [Pleionea sp. CnH1-48]
MAVEVFLVGGSVRDKLLDRPSEDNDWVVVGSTPAELLAEGYQQVGKDFPVFLHPETKEEYALARTEKKQGQGYQGFECYFAPDVTLEQDLMRRDLTINAIAQKHDGELVDPYHGISDIKNKILRHVSPAFVEDPLRVLRVARFAARYHTLGFTIAPETFALMQELAHSGEIELLSGERLWKETVRALSEPSPHIYFQVLHDCNALNCFFPELEKLWGIPNPEEWHPEIDTGIHTMMVLEQAAKLSDSTEVRFAALCHDLGKGLTPKEEWPSHRGHEKSGVPLIEAACKRLRIPKKYQQLAQIASEYHLHLHRIFEMDATAIVTLMENTGAYRHPHVFEQFILACEADFRGRTGFENKDYPQRHFLLSALEVSAPVSAQAFIKKGFQGKAIGEQIKKERIAKVQESTSVNNKKS